MGKKLLIGIIVAFVVIGLIVGAFFLFKPSQTTTTEKTGEGVVIGFSLGVLQEERWQNDLEAFTKRAEELGAVVDVESSQSDAAKQISQIENLIIKGVDVLVIVPHDAESLTESINKAHAAGIKVIAYDRMIKNADLDYYLSFDNEKVGEYEAQYVMDALQDKLGKGEKLKVAYIGGSPLDNNAFLVRDGSYKILQPLIDKGDIEIVVDKFSDGWSPDEAYKNLKAYLVSSNGAVDAVVCANDGTAFGAITALHEYSLDGKVPVSGQDAELSACQRIVQGTQTVTVYKPISDLAKTAADLAINVAKGEEVAITKTISNGKIDVPSILLAPIAVTKENLDDTVIKDGYQSFKDIYQQ